MAGKSAFTQEIADKICEGLIEGKSLRSICLEDGKLKASTVCFWLVKFPQFAEQYVRAREAQADTLADEMLDIADNGVNDWVERQDGTLEYNGDHVQRSRLRIDSRKWIASKMKPKVYGDKYIGEVTHNVSEEAAGWLGLKSST